MNLAGVMIPMGTAIGMVAAYFIPEVQLLLTKHKWHNKVIPGYITTGLGVADGFLSTWADHWGHFDWKHALIPTVVMTGIAMGKHSKVLKGTVGPLSEESLLKKFIK